MKPSTIGSVIGYFFLVLASMLYMVYLGEGFMNTFVRVEPENLLRFISLFTGSALLILGAMTFIQVGRLKERGL